MEPSVSLERVGLTRCFSKPSAKFCTNTPRTWGLTRFGQTPSMISEVFPSPAILGFRSSGITGVLPPCHTRSPSRVNAFISPPFPSGCASLPRSTQTLSRKTSGPVVSAPPESLREPRSSRGERGGFLLGSGKRLECKCALSLQHA